MATKQLDEIAKAVRTLLSKQAANNSAGGGGEKASSTGRNQSTPTPPKPQPTAAQTQPQQQPVQPQQQAQQPAQQPQQPAQQPPVPQQPAQPQQPVQANAAQAAGQANAAQQAQPQQGVEQSPQPKTNHTEAMKNMSSQEKADYLREQLKKFDDRRYERIHGQQQQSQQPVQANAAQAPEAQASITQTVTNPETGQPEEITGQFNPYTGEPLQSPTPASEPEGTTPQEVFNPQTGEKETLPEGAKVNPYTGQPLQPSTPAPEQQAASKTATIVNPETGEQEEVTGQVNPYTGKPLQNVTAQSQQQANAAQTAGQAEEEPQQPQTPQEQSQDPQQEERAFGTDVNAREKFQASKWGGSVTQEDIQATKKGSKEERQEATRSLSKKKFDYKINEVREKQAAGEEVSDTDIRLVHELKLTESLNNPTFGEEVNQTPEGEKAEALRVELSKKQEAGEEISNEDIMGLVSSQAEAGAARTANRNSQPQASQAPAAQPSSASASQYLREQQAAAKAIGANVSQAPAAQPTPTPAPEEETAQPPSTKEEPQWAKDMKEEMAQGMSSNMEGASAENMKATMTGSKEDRKAARNKIKEASAASVKNKISQQSQPSSAAAGTGTFETHMNMIREKQAAGGKLTQDDIQTAFDITLEDGLADTDLEEFGDDLTPEGKKSEELRAKLSKKKEAGEKISRDEIKELMLSQNNSRAAQRKKKAQQEKTGGQMVNKSKSSNFKKGQALIKAIDGLIQKQTPNANAAASAQRVATNTAASQKRTAANTAASQERTAANASQYLREQQAAAKAIGANAQAQQQTYANQNQQQQAYQNATQQQQAQPQQPVQGRLFPEPPTGTAKPEDVEARKVTSEGQARMRGFETPSNISPETYEYREDVKERQAEQNPEVVRRLQAQEEARQEETQELIGRAKRNRDDPGWRTREREAAEKEATDKRLAEIESGERLVGEVTPNEDLTTMEGVGRGVKNVGRGFKRRYAQLRAERAEREAEKLPRKTSAERKAEAREKRMTDAARKKEERQTDQDRRVAHAKQDAKIDYALQINAIDENTKNTLNNIFGRGAKAATRNKVAAGVEQGRSKIKTVENKLTLPASPLTGGVAEEITGEAGLTASHPKYRQEGSRDLVNRFIEQFGIASLNTQQGAQWLDSIKDGVMYAPEDSELHGLRIPGQESFDASKKIWEKILQPRELEQIGIETPALPAGEVAEKEEAVSPLSTSEQVEAGKEAGLEAKLTPSQKRAQARKNLEVDTDVQFNTKINQKAEKRKRVQARRNAEQKKKLGISGRKEQPKPKEEPSVAVNTPSNVVGNNVSENTENVTGNRRNTSTEGTPQNTRMVHVPREEEESDAVINVNSRELPEGETSIAIEAPAGREIEALEAPKETLALPEGRKPKTPSYSGSASGRQAAANQNAVLRNLSQAKTFTTATKNAISSFINDAEDKNVARAEIQQRIDDFQDNPEKWNKWTAEQAEGNYIKGTPVQQRTLRTEQNEIISNKLDTKTQSTIKDVIADAKEQGNEDKARNLIQTLLDEFGENSEKWAEWMKAYEAEGNQIGAYEAARNTASVSNRVFAASADNKMTRFAKSIIGKFDDLFEALSPTPEVEKEVPASFFYKSVKDTDLVVNDKAKHIVKGLDDFLEYTDEDKPPLRLNLFEKQDTDEDEGYTSRRQTERTQLGGHAGGKGWSGDHLVPMYRTVHRRIPRELILRAIRWVNPANFFKSTTGQPITELSDDDWRAMDRDELIKNISTLNEYREESLVIANRYDQMISLIEQGKTPYAVLWDDPDKWMTLDDRMDRAQDLKTGTAKWEDQLDKTALRLRKILGEEQFNTEDGEKSHFGMIDDLFDEDKGRIPFFKDISKRDKPWLRRTRGTGRFGESEEARRIIAANAVAGIRSARYQIPSMRETLRPTIQEIRSDEFRETMLQAPIYQGIRMPTEEELRSRDRLDITAEMIRQVAPNYSRPEESPFLRANQAGSGWQEEAGVDATTVRSTRFVAETLRLTRTPEEVAADSAYRERVERLEHRTATGAPVADALNPDNVPDEGEALVSVEELARWFGVHGSLSNHKVEAEEGEVASLFVRSPQPHEGEESNESVVQAVLKAFSLDREIALNNAPAVSQYSSGGQQGYLMESTLYVHDGRGLRKEEFAGFLGIKSWRNSFYKMMLLDVMCGSKQGRSPNEVSRALNAMGFRETGTRDNQWHGTNLEHMFKNRTPDGEIALFPYNMVEGDEFGQELKDFPMARKPGFKAPKFGLQGSTEENEEIDYSSEIQAFIQAALPRLDESQENFVRKTPDDENDDLWAALASRMASTVKPDAGGRNSSIKYEELKNTVASWMLQYFDKPEGKAILTSGTPDIE